VDVKWDKDIRIEWGKTDWNEKGYTQGGLNYSAEITRNDYELLRGDERDHERDSREHMGVEPRGDSDQPELAS
jgi:hypothetical protein